MLTTRVRSNTRVKNPKTLFLSVPLCLKSPEGCKLTPCLKFARPLPLNRRSRLHDNVYQGQNTSKLCSDAFLVNIQLDFRTNETCTFDNAFISITGFVSLFPFKEITWSICSLLNLFVFWSVDCCRSVILSVFSS